MVRCVELKMKCGGWDGITGGYLFEEAQEKKKESM
jgi:hypothetical protein